ncbi:MAG TPA: TonB family protein [Rhodocyclaceae bacterium]|jgi:protein TonB|nr:TonB family protein [Rhodocyclaceae bacterium]
MKLALPTSPGLKLGIGISLLFHAIVLSLHFHLPDALNRAGERALDVILVNSKHSNRPRDAQARAQANLDGGGNTTEDRIAATPLPPSVQDKEGDNLVETQRRVAELEAQQRELLTQTKSTRVIRNNKNSRDPQPQQTQPMSGADLASNALAIARLEAQISLQTDAYNKLPRKKFIGARTEEYRFAQYVEDWRQKVERIGNLNYPDTARGRIYGSLLMTITIRSDGSLENVEVTRSSGYKELDEAAKRIVRLAAPYAVFPEAIRRDTDVIEISRVWSFTNDDHLQTQ